MKTCREVIEFLIDYLAGEVSPEERARFDEHLASCPPCIAYIQTYEQTILIERHACRDDNPSLPPMPEELVQAILASRRGES